MFIKDRQSIINQEESGQHYSPWVIYGCLLIPFLLVATFTYIPILWAFQKSLYVFEIGGTAEFVGLDNYIDIISQDPTTVPSLFNIIILTAIRIAVIVVIPLIVARFIFLIKDRRLHRWYCFAFILPVVVPNIVHLLLWKSVIYSDVGLLNSFLDLIGKPELRNAWLSNPNTALIAIACIGFPFVSGFELMIFYAGFRNINPEILESAEMEGCNGIKRFIHIEIPCLMSQVKLIVLLALIYGIQAFENILVLTNGHPGFKTMVPGLQMYLNAFSFQRYGYACALGVTIFAIIFCLTYFTSKMIKSTEDVQSIR